MPASTPRALSASSFGIALLALLTACSAAAPTDGRSDADDSGDIASLETEAPASSEAADPLFAEYGEPVRLRLDMSDQESADAWAPRDRCFDDHYESTPSSGEGLMSAESGDPAAAAAAEELCLRLAPLPPWELDAQNPDALRFAQAVVDCLREGGVREVAISEPDDFGQIGFALGGEANDSASISLGMELTPVCLASVSERGER